MAVVGDTHPHRDHGDRPTGCIRKSANVVGRVRTVRAGAHLGDPITFGPLTARELTRTTSHGHGVRRWLPPRRWSRLMLLRMAPVGWMAGVRGTHRSRPLGMPAEVWILLRPRRFRSPGRNVRVLVWRDRRAPIRRGPLLRHLAMGCGLPWGFRTVWTWLTRWNRRVRSRCHGDIVRL